MLISAVGHLHVNADLAIAGNPYTLMRLESMGGDLNLNGDLTMGEGTITLLAQGERFDRAGELTMVDIDTEKLGAERMRNQTFADAAEKVMEVDSG